MNVFFTVDVEVWCGSWTDLDARFPTAFRQYVYGPTRDGEFGLRMQARHLQDHGLRGVFFVEPLFAGRFGIDPLAEIVGILKEAGQEVQLHLHPEWVDEAAVPLVPLTGDKRPLLRSFSLEDQTTLIAEGKRLLAKAGAGDVSCFRAGSFGFDHRTLEAVKACGLRFDASYNATLHGPDSGVATGQLLGDVYCDGPVTEFPMTVFRDGVGRLRHAQLGACSWGELESLLWQALEQGRQSLVILSHNFELLSPSKRSRDAVVHRRFKELCRFMARPGGEFRMAGFNELGSVERRKQPPVLSMSPVRTFGRVVEQAWRRRYA